MATQTELEDPDEVRKVYEDMDTRTLCQLLHAFAVDASTHHEHASVDGFVFCIDRAAIVIDVLSSRLPDVGTVGRVEH